MLKKIIILLFLVFSVFSIHSQSRRVQSPAYVAMALIDQPSVGKMVDICNYYGLEEIVPQVEESQLEEREPADGFRVFAHEDGTVIRFKMDSSEKGNLPVVEVRSPEKAAALKRILTDAGFEKVGPDYYKGSELAHRRTKAVVSTSPQAVITLTKEYKPDEQ